MPGLVTEKINQSFLDQFGCRFEGKTIIITGTNGKTTATKVLVSVLEDQGELVLNNRSGSNIKRGIISCVIEEASWFGSFKQCYAVFEVDEAYAPIVAKAINPDILVALNIFRDQMDRFSELDKTYKYIEDATRYSGHVVVNSDDPLLGRIAKIHKSVTSFGAATSVRSQLPSDDDLYSDTIDTKRIVSDIQLYKSQRENDQEQIEIHYGNGRIKLRSHLIGVHNSINLTAVYATLNNLGFSDEQFKISASKAEPAFGRGEIIKIDGQKVILMLVKNPAGFNQSLSALKADNMSPSLIGINDKIADGRDVSWLWDVDLENLLNINEDIICSGTRAEEMALRLKYARINSEVIINIKSALLRLTEIKTKNPKAIVATYTTMLEIRKQLSSKTKVKEFWK